MDSEGRWELETVIKIISVANEKWQSMPESPGREWWDSVIADVHMASELLRQFCDRVGQDYFCVRGFE